MEILTEPFKALMETLDETYGSLTLREAHVNHTKKVMDKLNSKGFEIVKI
jgi:hypothetical protein